jgi:hypothetical protein
MFRGCAASAPGDWAGLGNCYFWIVRAAGIAAALATQVLPFSDERITSTLAGFERAVYAVVAAGGPPGRRSASPAAPASRRPHAGLRPGAAIALSLNASATYPGVAMGGLLGGYLVATAAPVGSGCRPEPAARSRSCCSRCRWPPSDARSRDEVRDPGCGS